MGAVLTVVATVAMSASEQPEHDDGEDYELAITECAPWFLVTFGSG